MYLWLYFEKHPEAAAPFAIVSILILLVLLGSLVVESRSFDQKIDQGDIVIVGQEFGLNQTGHPLFTEVGRRTVPVSYGIKTYPRQREVTGCITILFPKSASKMYFAAPSNHDQMTITMPSQAGENVKVCVPDSLLRVPVYFWYE